MSQEEIDNFLIENGLSEDDIREDSLGRRFVEIKNEDGVLEKFYISK